MIVGKCAGNAHNGASDCPPLLGAYLGTLRIARRGLFLAGHATRSVVDSSLAVYRSCCAGLWYSHTVCRQGYSAAAELSRVWQFL